MNDRPANEDKNLHQNYDLSEPPEKVWRALTEPALVERWLMPNSAATGGERPGFRGDGGRLVCTLIDAEPGRRVSYAWREGALDSVVTFSVAANDAGGTRLTVVHSGPARASATAMLGAPGCRIALRPSGAPKNRHAANDTLAPILLAA